MRCSGWSAAWPLAFCGPPIPGIGPPIWLLARWRSFSTSTACADEFGLGTIGQSAVLIGLLTGLVDLTFLALCGKLRGWLHLLLVVAWLVQQCQQLPGNLRVVPLLRSHLSAYRIQELDKHVDPGKTK